MTIIGVVMFIGSAIITRVGLIYIVGGAVVGCVTPVTDCVFPINDVASAAAAFVPYTNVPNFVITYLTGVSQQSTDFNVICVCEVIIILSSSGII